MTNSKRCSKCHKKITEAVFGAWRIAFCDCNIVVGHLTNMAIMKMDKEGTNHGDVRKLVKELRISLMNYRREFDMLTKYFPPSKYKDMKGNPEFYDVDKVE